MYFTAYCIENLKSITAAFLLYQIIWVSVMTGFITVTSFLLQKTLQYNNWTSNLHYDNAIINTLPFPIDSKRDGNQTLTDCRRTIFKVNCCQLQSHFLTVTMAANKTDQSILVIITSLLLTEGIIRVISWSGNSNTQRNSKHGYNSLL